MQFYYFLTMSRQLIISRVETDFMCEEKRMKFSEISHYLFIPLGYRSFFRHKKEIIKIVNLKVIFGIDVGSGS